MSLYEQLQDSFKTYKKKYEDEIRNIILEWDSTESLAKNFERIFTSHTKELEDMRARKDAAYAERNKVVAAFAKLAVKSGYTAVLGKHEGPEDFGEWKHVVRIDLPAGQVSWHFTDAERSLFEGIPQGDAQWDGHTTEEKYRRLAEAF